MLIGQTNSWLAERTIQPDQTGAYSVVWFNASSSVTSAVAGVSVSIPPATLQSPMVQSGQLTFRFYGTRGVHYMVEYKQRLEDAPGSNWSNAPATRNSTR